jgi:acetyltransferase-like isoleucine patch superfamily enzyme
MAHVLAHDWFPRPLPDNVRIGARSWCHSAHAFVHCHSQRACAVSIGSDSACYAGTYFDLGPAGEVRIGNYCTLVSAILCTNGRVVIDDYSLIAHDVVMADSAWARPGPTGEAHQTNDPASVITLGKRTWVGARAVLLGGTRLGEGAIVGAGAVVDCEVPPFAIVAGNPARIVGWARPGASRP